MALTHSLPRMIRRQRRPPSARIVVRGGFEPDTVFARAGRPLQIVFRREETASCSERVVFPALGRSAMLPPFQDVTLELLPPEAGEYEFTCQLGLLRGRLIVIPDEPGMDERRRS